MSQDQYVRAIERIDHQTRSAVVLVILSAVFFAGVLARVCLPLPF